VQKRKGSTAMEGNMPRNLRLFSLSTGKSRKEEGSRKGLKKKKKADGVRNAIELGVSTRNKEPRQSLLRLTWICIDDLPRKLTSGAHSKTERQPESKRTGTRSGEDCTLNESWVFERNWLEHKNNYIKYIKISTFFDGDAPTRKVCKVVHTGAGPY